MGKKEIAEEVRRSIYRDMVNARSRILQRYPFYGKLLMHLQLGVSDCGTAYTDMKHLVFDPEFALSLSPEEMIFIMLHEVLHCALQHCLRGRELLPERFNVACDIVVNSNILHTMGLDSFSVRGIPAMHLVPDGREGYLFSAEEVYAMLQDREKSTKGNEDKSGAGSEEKEDQQAEQGDVTENGSRMDSHEEWGEIEVTDATEDTWKTIVKDASNGYSNVDVPPSMRDYLRDLEMEAKVDWRSVLQDFIQLFHDRYDYSFMPADRRYACSDYVMPSFSEQEEEKVENLWFCVDTSGSIEIDVLSEIMAEIRQALLLFEHISGKISFFDTKMTEPVPIETQEDIEKISPIGGGGTSFQVIFTYMKKEMEDNLPTAVIILTDGECYYPKEEAAMDVPVLWIIYNNPKDPPWGRFVHVDTK